MLKTKKFIAATIISIMALSQSAFAAVPMLSGDTYYGMTAAEIATHYEEAPYYNGLPSLKITIPMEQEYKTSDVEGELGVFIVDLDKTLPEYKLQELYREAAVLVVEKEFGIDGECSTIRGLGSTKFLKHGIFKIAYMVKDTKTNSLVANVYVDLVINTADQPRIDLPKEVEATPAAEVSDKSKYTFPDFPRKADLTTKNDLYYTEEKAAKIYKLYEDGKISGSPDGKFYPKSSVTRAEFATMLVSILGLESKGNTESFSDTNGHWAKNAIDIAVSNGLIKGVSSDKFDPNGKVTHEQIAVICERILEAHGEYVTLTDGEWNAIKNNAELSYGKEAVAKCLKLGLFEDTNYWRPASPTTRDDAVIIIYELGEMIK